MIRTLSLADLAAADRLERIVFKAGPTTLDEFAALLERRGYANVFEKQRRIIGVCWIEPGKQADTIYSIAVQPRHQGRGVGRALIQRAQLNGRPLELQVRCSNVDAARLYARLGFKRVRKLAKYYQDEDGLLMRWAPVYRGRR